MNSILKYNVPAADTFEVDMPEGAQILSVQTQLGQPYIWACGRANNPMREMRTFRLIATGQTFPEEVTQARTVAEGVALLHIGTFQITNEERPMVFHLFELLRSIKIAKLPPAPLG